MPSTVLPPMSGNPQERLTLRRILSFLADLLEGGECVKRCLKCACWTFIFCSVRTRYASDSGEKNMSAQALAEPCVESSPVLALLPVSKRVRFEKYWKEYSALPRWDDPERLRLQADLAAGLMLPEQQRSSPNYCFGRGRRSATI